ncbi:BREX-2 system adenine-specific DNA-methyltransferase PglX [Cellulomonas endophytica]|uniref:BREX-2 system adenine-specific DNA-methyltransferase PglX n=1 Tax=Cellulomonas endophytica TaxID=2494735 RepID=UPI001010A638|nr:BREX-2 system adenine-specific DNA-methyltransferase PglX [Cellulomonas endophytica]
MDTAALLKDLRGLLKTVVADLTERAEDPSVPWSHTLKDEFESAISADRTAAPWISWRDDRLDQSAVAWLLACIFLRYCEDNGLLAGARTPSGIPGPWIAGATEGPAGDLVRRAQENEDAYFEDHRADNHGDWLRDAFGALQSTPAGAALLDRRHNPVWSISLSGHVAKALIDFFREREVDGTLKRSFATDPGDTRFLGDVYQNLSEHARDTYALLQTPDFVEELILDRTLDPALDEFGIDGFRMIDPTCGSGHFLLGAFGRIVGRWEAERPDLDARERVARALRSVNGVDLNPFASAIAKFRLTIAALQACGEQSLVGAPRFEMRVAVGDSLLGAQGRQGELNLLSTHDAFTYETEDLGDYASILEQGQYHVVVGNPPYITVKDKALNTAYRLAYPTCHRQYALTVPFMELFFRLAVPAGPLNGAGYVGQITSNSFMKREFGVKVIEGLLSGRDLGTRVDLVDVIDTSGAYIPGHGTPTVILVGRRRTPTNEPVNTILGVRGEPGQPQDPRQGLVWSEIRDHLDDGSFNGSYVTVRPTDRATLSKHPWSLAGGISQAVVEQIEGAAFRTLGDAIERNIGGAIRAGADEAYMRPRLVAREAHVAARFRPFVIGEDVRDYSWSASDLIAFPYDDDLRADGALDTVLWPWRTPLARRTTFKGSMADAGLRWSAYMQFTKWAITAPMSITFAEVATHNHFVLDRGGKVFKQTAPVIKLPEGASEDDHLALLAVLNSSTACFWLKQVSHNKGSTVDTKGARQTLAPWEDFYQFGGTKLQKFPLPQTCQLERGRTLDSLAQRLAANHPSAVLRGHLRDLPATLSASKASSATLRAAMAFQQEELDWAIYREFGLVDEPLTYESSDVDELELGQRAFEVVLARSGEDTAWFDRHGSTPTTELPASWPAGYRALVERRLEVIASNPQIALLERPEYKRRWASATWEELERRALTEALLDKLDEPSLWGSGLQPQVRTVAELADLLRADASVAAMVRRLVGREDADVTATLQQVALGEAVPYLASLRYKPTGIEKYRAWQEVWDLQRLEDRIDAGAPGTRPEVPAPPKYKPADFLRNEHWRARGKLDVPKERFVLYPGVSRQGDPTAVLGWAGWDHAQQGLALASLVSEVRASSVVGDVVPLLAGITELEPWVEQWHAELLPEYGFSPAESLRQFLDQQFDEEQTTRADVTAWTPPAPTRGRKRKET